MAAEVGDDVGCGLEEVGRGVRRIRDGGEADACVAQASSGGVHRAGLRVAVSRVVRSPGRLQDTVRATGSVAKEQLQRRQRQQFR